MRVEMRIQHHGALRVVHDELIHHLPAGIGVVGADELHERRESLVQPQVAPPFHGHQVAEPLYRENKTKQKC